MTMANTHPEAVRPSETVTRDPPRWEASSTLLAVASRIGCNIFGRRLLVVGMEAKLTAEVSSTDTFETLFDREWRPMLQVAYLIVGSHAVAEEIVQEAFTVVLDRWESIDRPGGYLRTTVVRAAVRAAALSRRERDAVSAQHPDVAYQPDHEGIWEQLEHLSSRQRSALVLRFHADLSLDDVAETLGCRPATARSLVRRGLEELRKKELR